MNQFTVGIALPAKLSCNGGAESVEWTLGRHWQLLQTICLQELMEMTNRAKWKNGA